jgi:hypothetical protein
MDLSNAEWRTSTRSSNNGGDCVEVAAVDATEPPPGQAGR